jgi:Ca2+-binding RTX toxin-like protein
MATIVLNGSVLFSDTYPNPSLIQALNNIVYNGGNYFADVELSAYANQTWSNANFNDTSSTDQSISWTSQEGSSLTTKIKNYSYINNGVTEYNPWINSFTFNSSEKTGGKTRLVLKSDYTESGSTHTSTSSYTDLGETTSVTDDIVGAGTKTYTFTESNINNVFTYSRDGTYTWNYARDGVDLKLTNGKFKDKMVFDGALAPSDSGTNDHTYTLTDSSNGLVVSFSGKITYDTSTLETFATRTYVLTNLSVANANLTAVTASLTLVGDDFNIFEGGPDYLSNGTLAAPDLAALSDSLGANLLPLALDRDNTVTLKNTGVAFNAGAGNDTVTGSAGNDTIDGDLGNDTINAGTGDDTIAWTGGNDKIDGGAGTDILDLTGFGNGNGAYTLNDRGSSTYLVSGTATSFTILNKADNTSATIAGVESVIIGGETVSVGKFLAPNSMDITGTNLISDTLDRIPSIKDMIAYGPDGSGLEFGDHMDMTRFSGESWGAAQSFNPDAASNALTFTAASGAKLVFSNSQSSTATSDNYAVSFNLTGPTATAALNKTDKFVGSYSRKDTFTAPTSAGVSTGNVDESGSVTYVDSKNTVTTTDDVTITLSSAEKASWSNTWDTANSRQTANSWSSTSSGGIAYKSTSLNVDLAYTGTDGFSEAYSADSGTMVLSKNLSTTTISKYSFADTRADATTPLTLSFTSLVTQDHLAETENWNLKTVALGTVDYTLTSAALVINRNTANDSSLFEAVNFGGNKEQGSIEGAADSLESVFVPLILAGDNTVTLKTTGVEFNAGAGNDTVTGSAGNDMIDGAAGNDTITSGTGDDTIAWTGGNDKIDGGTGTDILDLTGFGDDTNLYTLEDRNSLTYVVSGTAASFTILNKFNNATATVTGVETVRIGGEDVSVGRFLAPNSMDITGGNLLSNELSNLPSIDEAVNTGGLLGFSGGPVNFGYLMDFSRFETENWGAAQSYNPDAASNALTFTSASTGSKLIYSDSQSVTANSENRAISFNLTGPTTTNALNKADKFVGTGSSKSTWSTDASGKTTDTGDASSTVTYVDSKGTAATTDDVTIVVTSGKKDVYTESTVANGSDWTDTLAVNYKTSTLNIDIAMTGVGSYAATVNGNQYTQTKNIYTTTMSKYSFSDTRDASNLFTLSFNGTNTANYLNANESSTAAVNLKTVVLATSNYSLTTASVSYTQSLNNNPIFTKNLGLGWNWNGNPDSQLPVEGVAEGLREVFVPSILAGDNVVTLKNTGVAFNAGAGNDTITGSAGNDTIDGGLGNDTITAGTGDDIIAWTGGNDKLDGGANAANGADILDLSNFGNGTSLYTLEDRGNSTYLVSGTKASFTITNKFNNTTATIAGIETVRIGGEDVSVDRFLAPNLTFITGLDALTTEFDVRNAPSVLGLAAETRSAAGELVDIGDVTGQVWTSEQGFNPDALSNNLTFTNGDKSTVTIKTTQTADGNSYTSSASLKSGDAAIKFDGSYSSVLKAGSTLLAGTKTITRALTFSDTRGTTDTNDDVSSSFSDSKAKVYTTSNGIFSETSTQTLKTSFSVSDMSYDNSPFIYKLSVDLSIKGNYEYNQNTQTVTVDQRLHTVNSYSLTSGVPANPRTSLTFTGTVLSNELTNQETYALKNVVWNDYSAKIITANANFIAEGGQIFGGVGDGEMQENGVSDILYNQQTYLLPKLLANDNVVTMKYNWSGFNAGAGNDKVTGTNSRDTIWGGAGNDIILGGGAGDTLYGGTGIDKLTGGVGADMFIFQAGDTAWNNTMTIPSFDQILDFQKGPTGKGDVIAYGTVGEFVQNSQMTNLTPISLKIGGVSGVASIDQASINQTAGITTFAAGSGKTLADAVKDLASSFTAGQDEQGELALFKVNNAGSYYAFISDGEAGLTANDVVIQLSGITKINGLDLTNGALHIM